MKVDSVQLSWVSQCTAPIKKNKNKQNSFCVPFVISSLKPRFDRMSFFDVGPSCFLFSASNFAYSENNWCNWWKEIFSVAPYWDLGYLFPLFLFTSFGRWVHGKSAVHVQLYKWPTLSPVTRVPWAAAGTWWWTTIIIGPMASTTATWCTSNNSTIRNWGSIAVLVAFHRTIIIKYFFTNLLLYDPSRPIPAVVICTFSRTLSLSLKN